MYPKELDLLKAALIMRKKMNYRYIIPNLQDADLQYADLQDADLRSAKLQYADLRSANLQYADLRGADLWSANLQSANLQYADLRGADLRSADLQSANLQSAKLRGIKPNWQSHVLLAELVYRSTLFNKNALAGIVLFGQRNNQCWRDFLAMDIPNIQKTLLYLQTFETADNPMPDIVQKWLQNNK